jgi:spore coat polysaccharide biosynthesis protein SpsF
VRIVATIQARMGSTRLPGKVLRLIGGKPMLQHQVERVRRSRLVDEVVIATTASERDNPIAELGQRLGVGVYRGPEDDVLKRIANLLAAWDVDVHVELIGDSPFTDPQLVDEIIGFYLKHCDDYDYVSNGIELSYPSGMEVNVYPAAALIEADSKVAVDDPLREHVDIHLSKNPCYRRYSVTAPSWFRRPEIFLEVDTVKDFQMVEAVFTHFLELGKDHFTLSQILDFLDSRPDLIALNQNEERRWWQFKENLTGSP